MTRTSKNVRKNEVRSAHSLNPLSAKSAASDIAQKEDGMDSRYAVLQASSTQSILSNTPKKICAAVVTQFYLLSDVQTAL